MTRIFIWGRMTPSGSPSPMPLPSPFFKYFEKDPLMATTTPLQTSFYPSRPSTSPASLPNEKFDHTHSKTPSCVKGKTLFWLQFFRQHLADRKYCRPHHQSQLSPKGWYLYNALLHASSALFMEIKLKM